MLFAIIIFICGGKTNGLKNRGAAMNVMIF